MISEFLLISANFRWNKQHSSETEVNSESINELALNQKNSAQNLTWFRFWLSSELALELDTRKMDSLIVDSSIQKNLYFDLIIQDNKCILSLLCNFTSVLQNEEIK